MTFHDFHYLNIHFRLQLSIRMLLQRRWTLLMKKISHFHLRIILCKRMQQLKYVISLWLWSLKNSMMLYFGDLYFQKHLTEPVFLKSGRFFQNIASLFWQLTVETSANRTVRKNLDHTNFAAFINITILKYENKWSKIVNILLKF